MSRAVIFWLDIGVDGGCLDGATRKVFLEGPAMGGMALMKFTDGRPCAVGGATEVVERLPGWLR